MPINQVRKQIRSHPIWEVTTFAHWWREMCELEVLLEYRRSSPEAQATWDSILSTQIPHPSPALIDEIRASAGLRAALRARGAILCGTLLEMLITKAWDDGLELPHLALLAAFRLRLNLESAVHSVRTGKKPLG